MTQFEGQGLALACFVAVIVEGGLALLRFAPPSLRDRCGFIEGTFAETDDNGARHP